MLFDAVQFNLIFHDIILRVYIVLRCAYIMQDHIEINLRFKATKCMNGINIPAQHVNPFKFLSASKDHQTSTIAVDL